MRAPRKAIPAPKKYALLYMRTVSRSNLPATDMSLVWKEKEAALTGNRFRQSTRSRPARDWSALRTEKQKRTNQSTKQTSEGTTAVRTS